MSLSLRDSGHLTPTVYESQCDGQLIGVDNEGARCYKRFDTNANSWQNAKDLCSNWGGHLLVLRDEAEWVLVRDFVLGNHNSHYYIGALYQGSTGCCCNNGCSSGQANKYYWQSQGGGALSSVDDCSHSVAIR